MKDVIIDIETMGVKPRAAICSIGAVAFDMQTGQVDHENGFYMPIRWEDQGRIVDPETNKWWDKQSPEARLSLEGMTDLRTALEAFHKWFTARGVYPWGNGPSFDISILENGFDQFGISYPWKFWNVRDVRTIVDIAKGIVSKDSIPFDGIKHNAWYDACHEAKMVCEMYKGIRSCKW